MYSSEEIFLDLKKELELEEEIAVENNEIPSFEKEEIPTFLKAIRDSEEEENRFVNNEVNKPAKNVDPDLKKKAIKKGKEYQDYLKKDNCPFQKEYLNGTERLLRMIQADRIKNNDLKHLIAVVWNKRYYRTFNNIA